MSDITVYTLYPEVEIDERGRYFDGQFLTAQDFVDEQRYHVDRLRRALDLLTVPGVARGLELAAAGPWLLRLQPGTAVDEHGRLLVVPSVRDNIPVPRDLPGGAADVSLFYAEVESRVQGGTSEEQGTRGATRLREVPALEFHPQDAAPTRAGAVRIGRLGVDANGTITLAPAAEVRACAGLRLPAEPDGGPVLRSGGGARPNLLHGTCDFAVSGRLAVATRDPEAALDVRGLARVDDLSVREHGFRVDGDEAQFYPVVFRDLDWTAGAAVLEISRANAQADAANAGALMARLRWHAGDGQGAELLACEIVQTRRFIAAARVLGSDRLLAVWLRGNRSYAWRAGQRTELVDARAVASKTLGGETLKPRADIDPAFDRDRVSLGVSYGQIELRGAVSVAGDLAYSGKQSRLDVAEQPFAVVRSYDLLLGHSTRRGQPARALVDDTKTLVVNYNADWPNLSLGGAATVVEGTLTAKGNTRVVHNEPSLTVARPGGQATGGAKLFLELVQEDVSAAKVPEVGVSLRFHHFSRFWHRIEARADGLHVRHGDLASDNYKALFAGNITANGQLAVTGALSVGAGATITGALTVNAGATITGALSVRAGATISGALSVSAGATISGAFTASAGATVTGDLTYSGKQSRLDVADQFAATVRCADFYLGYSGRRGSPGRALVDDTKTLVLNYNADWPNLVLGGATVEVPGTLTAKDITSNGQLVVTGSDERVRVVRGTVNGDGGIVEGKGFSVSKQGQLWKITFTTAFSNEPTVVATQQYPDDDNCDDNGGSTLDNAVIVGVRKTECYVKTGDGDGDHAWRRFHFIAIGPYG